MSSVSCGQRRSGLFLLIAMVTASLCSVRTSAATMNPFTWLDCPSPPPSPSPSPPAASSINSTFQSNVFALLHALPSAAAPTGFASLSLGEDADRAFVRGICRGDSTPDDCSAFLTSAVADINGHCNTNRRAAIWYDKCFLSYADTNASTSYEDAFRQELYNYRNFSDKGAWAYYELIGNLAARAANGSSSPPMFATGKLVYDSEAPNGTMYGLVQCMRDRTVAECEQCLRDTVQQLPSCCWKHQGGVVLAYNCYLRVEIYTFFDLALALDPPQPPAPPSLAPSPTSSMASTEESSGKRKIGAILAAAIPVGTLLLAVTSLAGILFYKRKADCNTTTPDINNSEEDISYFHPEQLNLQVLSVATNNFSGENKLGEGGFGEVFKGILHGRKEIAVKRLSKHSSQGFHELKNELVVAAKLKHRNLTRLLGVCLQEEKLLVYEYMPNRSLDTFLFDPMRRQQLDWHKRFTIIRGIVRGLLYLHEESRLKVIHRDLKPSNVLLDADMNPKISDFGLARPFGGDQSIDITRRPVGTLGYMSPEYAYCGHVSTKSDMFSFGVIVLEIVTGRRSNSVHECSDSEFLLGYVWGKWTIGSIAEVVDPLLAGHGPYPESEVLNCVEVGLLCVQENPAERPDASSVAIMLDSTTSMSGNRRTPSRPAFVFGSDLTTRWNCPAAGALTCDGALIGNKKSMVTVSVNEVSISEVQPR